MAIDTSRVKEAAGFDSSYRCRFGHVTETYYVMFEDGSRIGGSAWDYCSYCAEGPSQADVIRMDLDIYNQWLQAEIIDGQEFVRIAQQAVNNPVNNPYKPWATRMVEYIESRPDLFPNDE